MDIRYVDVRSQIEWLCDAMIPADTVLGFPSAREVRVPDKLLPEALSTRPDLAPQFLAVVAAFPALAPGDPLQFVRDLSKEQRAAVGRFIAGAYFSSPLIMEKLGYPGFKPRPFEPDFKAVFEATAVVRARGECYRKS